MVFRFILYGLIGLAVEVLWTAFYDKVFNNKKGWDLQGTTYVWMLPIYGLTTFVFEPTHNILRNTSWYYRGLVYMVGIFVVEYIIGYCFKVLDRCPWDYSLKTKLHLKGLIRLDYAPLWFLFGLVLEPTHDMLVKITPLVYTALHF